MVTQTAMNSISATEAMNDDLATMKRALQSVAPGTALREGLGRIQRSRTGALIVLGYNDQVLSLCSGGFELDVPFTAARLRELCKMDGAVVIDPEHWRIRLANVQLLPDPSIPTTESGTRHRTAQRTARQTHLPVISVSASMSRITIYAGSLHQAVEEPEVLMARANLAIDTLDRYTQRLDEVLQTLTVMEMQGSASVRDVATVLQRMEMIRRISTEISGFLDDLGSESRLLALQMDDLLHGSASQRALVLRDYIASPDEMATAEVTLSDLPGDKLINLVDIANVLSLGVYDVTDLDRLVQPRGYRALSLVPRLPWTVMKDVVSHWKSLPDILSVSVDELQEVESVGPYRAKLIHDSLLRQQEMAESGIFGW